MKKVLVVDDVPEVRMVLRALLEEPEVEVVEAGDGQQALDALAVEPVDLVITDCKMPNMNGIELMRRAKEEYPAVPFIVVSSTARSEDLVDLKPRAVMSKPFKLLELKEAVAETLSE